MTKSEIRNFACKISEIHHKLQALRLAKHPFSCCSASIYVITGP